ncbi:abortive infection system antitoxin AbiGi family protein [Aneurinibacillus tyrosinisolvens]|uniref:abortive infection system antitoxin AbiGi family protein n=1 Tax=Aneurinibacillus tyrosinisolvens TaxID=1443435 RepID=UPI00063F7412|nr:abortive infection system antitoxin AbiGi family protein [Aneurinibacillus tyrosinisolvens]
MQRYYSNIYWHFTGSPNVNWHLVKKPGDIQKYGVPKLDREAVDILLRILQSKKLLAKCTEKISDTMITEHFCSTTDIPFKDLVTHSPYYGRVAIGFTARAIHKKFMPVLYIPVHNMPFINRILTNMEIQGEKEAGGQLAYTYSGVREVDSSQIAGFLMNFLKVTDFGAREGDSLYREREWRHLGHFNFDVRDVAAIVVPQDYISELSVYLAGDRYLHNVSLISWEFIENS